MKRFKLITLILAAFALLAAVPAQAANQDMWAYVYKWDGKMSSDGKPVLTRLTSGVTFKVLAQNSDTAETLYYYKGSTSLTNPVTTTNFAANTVCNDQVRFRVDPTDTTYDRYVDLIVVDTNGGYTAFIEDFDKYTHSIIIDERPNIMHHGIIWFDATTTDETDTGIDFLADTMVHDVRVEVVTTASAKTLDVGLLSTETSGDADGFRDAVLLTTAGYVADTGVVTDGTTIDWTATSTYGALLYKSISGSDAVASGGGRSYLGHIVTSGKASSLTYSQSSTSGDGYIHYFFTRLR
jgi:tetrahydromethanopterin S-methyltransferase subunit F